MEWTLLIFGQCHFFFFGGGDLQWMCALDRCSRLIGVLLVGFYTQRRALWVHQSLQRAGHTACYQWKLGLNFLGPLSAPIFSKLQCHLPEVDRFMNAKRKRGRKHRECRSSVLLIMETSRGQKWCYLPGAGQPFLCMGWVCFVYPRVLVVKPVVIERLKVGGVRLRAWLASQRHALTTCGVLAWCLMRMDSVFLGCLSWQWFSVLWEWEQGKLAYALLCIVWLYFSHASYVTENSVTPRTFILIIFPPLLPSSLCICHAPRVGLSGQLVRVGSFLSPLSFQGSNSGHRHWQKALFPTSHLAPIFLISLNSLITVT